MKNRLLETSKFRVVNSNLNIKIHHRPVGSPQKNRQNKALTSSKYDVSPAPGIPSDLRTITTKARFKGGYKPAEQ